MPLYEHVLLGRQDISPQQFEGLVESYQAIIKDNGGSVEKTELWGLKNLAYKIKKNRKAHFALMNIDSPHAAVAEMERQMGLSTDVIRFLTLRVDELEEGPSAMTKRGDRDDRRGGRRDHHRDRDSRPAPAKQAAPAPAAEAKEGSADAAESADSKETGKDAGKEE
ncbi:MAG: 30S ribosomal protein S6 [Hyphomicrobiaceae bacterium]|nr:30S ribosomal protein S6 [Hyphomicrobiaceae bacterium]